MLKKILIFLKKVFSFNFVFVLLIFLVIIFFLNSFVFQNFIYIDYFNRLGPLLSEIIFFFNIDNLYKSLFFNLIIIFFLFLILFCIFENFKYLKNNFFRKLIYTLIHITIFFIIFFIFFSDKYCELKLLIIKNNFILKNFFGFSSYIWIPEGWSLKNFLIKDHNKLYIFKIPIRLNLNKVYIYYNESSQIKKVSINIFFKKINNFLKLNLETNFPFLYTDILFYNSGYYNFFKLNMFINFIYKKSFKKVLLKTYMGDSFFLKSIFPNIKKNFLLEIISIENSGLSLKYDNYYYNNFFYKIKKFFYILDNNLFNLGPYMKINIYDETMYKIFEINSYLNFFKEIDFNFNLLSIKFLNKNKIFYFKIPINFNNNLNSTFLKINNIFLDNHVKLLFINRLFKNKNIFKNININYFFNFLLLKNLNKIFLNFNDFDYDINYSDFFFSLLFFYYKYNFFINDNFFYFFLEKLFKISKNSNKTKVILNDFENLYFSNYNFLSLILLKKYFYFEINSVEYKNSSILFTSNNNNSNNIIIFIFLFFFSIFLNFYFKFLKYES